MVFTSHEEQILKHQREGGRDGGREREITYNPAAMNF